MNNVQQSAQTQQQSALVEWAVGRRKNEPGDDTVVPVVKSTPNGILVGLIDANGRGEKPLRAAQIAASVLESWTHHPLVEMINRLDKECRGTTGVAVNAAIFTNSYNSVNWFGVGNIRGVVFRRSPAANPRHVVLDQVQGLVGTDQFRLRELCQPVKPGDLVIFASDGLDPSFVEALPIDGKPRVVADQLLENYCLAGRDAVIIVVRYLGSHG